MAHIDRPITHGQPAPPMPVENVPLMTVKPDVNFDTGASVNPTRSLEVVPQTLGGSMPFSPGPAHGSGGFGPSV